VDLMTTSLNVWPNHSRKARLRNYLLRLLSDGMEFRAATTAAIKGVLMKAKTYAIAGPILLTTQGFEDDRGFFLRELECAQLFAAALGVSEAETPYFHAGTTLPARGQEWLLWLFTINCRPEPQAQLVRLSSAGEIFCVAVDIPGQLGHFRQWVGERLSAENTMFAVDTTRLFAHGFSP